VSFAFLLALEALSPTQRAVLVLADVLEYSAREVGEALDMSEGNARVVLHRARRALERYDATRNPPTAAMRERTREALGRFLACLAQRDAAGLEALLAEDVVLRSDGGGEFNAALVPVHGRAHVADLHLKILRDEMPRARVVELNGLPSLVAEYAKPKRRAAPRFTFSVELDRDGRIRAVHSVLKSEKLGRIAAAWA
jgi:RNA polymerase sigma-70 factor (ECF subfamily)